MFFKMATPVTSLKIDSSTVKFCETPVKFAKVLRKSFLHRIPPMAASGFIKDCKSQAPPEGLNYELLSCNAVT